MIISMIDKNKYDQKLNKEDKIREEIIDSIVIYHDFIRKKYDISSVSIREINIFNIFFIFFMDYLKKIDDTLKK